MKTNTNNSSTAEKCQECGGAGSQPGLQGTWSCPTCGGSGVRRLRGDAQKVTGVSRDGGGCDPINQSLLTSTATEGTR